jgi:uncharacterized membrane protein YkvA (DUF1232 family)
MLNKAQAVVQDAVRLNQLANDVQGKIKTNEGRIKSFWLDLKSLHQMTIAWVRGEYREVPYRTVVSAVAALVYFVNPLDLLPDFLLGGFIDDALVVGYVLSSVKSDVEKFRLECGKRPAA